MKIRRVGAEFHEDGQTDMTKFRNFANAQSMTDDNKRKKVKVNQKKKKKIKRILTLTEGT
jgi:hypothetical protein